MLSEVGSKDSDVVFAPVRVGRSGCKEELEAGAWKVITEAREGGTAGHLRLGGGMRTGLIDEIAHEIGLDDLIFEAPTKASQAWFIKQFGPDVNLGNIPPEEVIPLETLRLGLRGDTLKEILLDGDLRPLEADAPAAERPAAPDLDFEAMSAEDVLRWAYAEFGAEPLPDLLVAEAVVGARAHGLRARARRRRDRARHAALLPRDLRDARRGSSSATGST